MARNDVFRRHDDGGLVLDLQSELLDPLNTRVVATLLPKSIAPAPAVRLDPVLTIEDEPYVLTTQFMAAVPVTLLGDRVEALDLQHDEISAATDMVFFGF